MLSAFKEHHSTKGVVESCSLYTLTHFIFLLNKETSAKSKLKEQITVKHLFA